MRPGNRRGASTRKRGPARKQRSQPRAKSKTRVPTKRWSQRVTRESNALDLEAGVFMMRNPKEIAASLKRSADQSSRRKSEPYRSAMSMLTFYINRAGTQLSSMQKSRLERAKDELRALYHKPPRRKRATTRRGSRKG